MTETRGAYLMNLGQVGYHEAWELQRSLAAAVGQGAIPDTVLLLEHPPTITLGRRTEAGEVHIPVRRLGRARRIGSRRQVDLPRARAARLLPDPRPQPARARRQALLPEPRGGDHPHGRDVRARGDSDRRAHRRLAPLAAEEDRVDRRPHLTLGHDAWVRAQRRSRSCAVHRVDHRLRARRRRVHDARARDRHAGHGRRRPATGGRRTGRGVRPHARRAAGSRGGTVAAAAPRAALHPLIQRIPVSIAKLRLWLPARTVTCAGWIRMPAEARTA